MMGRVGILKTKSRAITPIYSRDYTFDPGSNVVAHPFSHMPGLVVFSRGTWTLPGDEQVVEVRVKLELYIGTWAEGGLPGVEISGRHLVIAPALHDEHGLGRRSGGSGRFIAA